jgi:hypothetical protein
MKRALPVIAIILLVCVTGFAQGSFGPGQRDPFTLQQPGPAVSEGSGSRHQGIFRDLGRSFVEPGLANPGAADGRLFTLANAFSWTTPISTPDFLPTFSPSQPAAHSAMSNNRYSSDKLVDFRPSPTYAGGEVGFLYGRSTGKFGGDFKQGYIIGEVGNERFHISVGAAYEDSTTSRIFRGAR